MNINGQGNEKGRGRKDTKRAGGGLLGVEIQNMRRSLERHVWEDTLYMIENTQKLSLGTWREKTQKQKRKLKGKKGKRMCERKERQWREDVWSNGGKKLWNVKERTEKSTEWY